MRIVFMGTPDFAVPTLRYCMAHEQVVGVVTQPDRRAGRGKKKTLPPVKVEANRAKIPVLQPERLRDEAAIEQIRALAPDLIVVVAYGQILPKAVLALPRYGCFNVHASLLPKLRGAAPIHRAILQGFQTTGVTIMQMDEGLDTGDMLVRRTCPIDPDMTAGSLHDVLMQLGVEALAEALERLKDGRLAPEKQSDDQATYAAMLSRDEAGLDFGLSATALERRVRGLYPWPMAWALREGQRVKVHSAQAKPVAHGQPPGTLLEISDRGLLVACGEGALLIDRLQFPGSRAMSVAEYLRGHDIDRSIGFHKGE